MPKSRITFIGLRPNTVAATNVACQQPCRHPQSQRNQDAKETHRHRERALEIGERLGIYRDYPVSSELR